MSTWTAEDLDRIGAAKELDIATERSDGTLRSYLPIWVVRIGDELYVRAYRGRGGSWFRQVQRHPRASIRAGGVERTVSFEAADDSLRLRDGRRLSRQVRQRHVRRRDDRARGRRGGVADRPLNAATPGLRPWVAEPGG